MNRHTRDSPPVLLPFKRPLSCLVILFSCFACSGYAEPPTVPEPLESTRLDRSHRHLSNRVLRLAESVNNVITDAFRRKQDHESEMTRQFYGNLLTAYQVEGSHIRVTPRFTMTEGGDTQYKLDFSARLRLPDISKRLRLYADSYDTDDDTLADVFSPRYRQKREADRNDGVAAGLTYFFSDRTRRQVSLSTGLRFRPQPSPKIRLRGRFRKSFDNWNADLAQTGFWSERDGFGEKTEFTLERAFREIHRLRLRSSLVWSELSHGVDWGQLASHHTQFSTRHSTAISLGVRGYSHPSWIVDHYLARVAYRKRMHRDWMFLEIEPGLDFFREDDFKATPLITIKLEIVFGSFPSL